MTTCGVLGVLLVNQQTWQRSWEALTYLSSSSLPMCHGPHLPPSWYLESWEPQNSPFELFNWVNGLVFFSGGFPRTGHSYILGCAHVSASLYLKTLPLCKLQTCQSWITVTRGFLKPQIITDKIIIHTLKRLLSVAQQERDNLLKRLWIRRNAKSLLKQKHTDWQRKRWLK